MRDPIRRHRVKQALVALLATGMAAGVLTSTASAASGVISGSVWEDANRDGRFDTGEAPMPGRWVFVYRTDGSWVASAPTNSTGRYSITGLTPGDYWVEYDASSWSAMRADWVPTSTGSLQARVEVHVDGAATADFGWRRIVRSTTIGAPISSTVGPDGLRVESYNDVVPAIELYAALVAGAPRTAEAASTLVRFDVDPISHTSTSVNGERGSWSGYTSTIHVTWLSWIDGGDTTLFHEYGHAWSLYHAYITQQDDSLQAYLDARGISGDPRLDSDHGWDRRELIAEDYRQLFGSPHARLAPQENRDLPPAAQVPGLADFLASTYTRPSLPPPDPVPEPDPQPAPAPDLTVDGLAMNPDPVVSSGTVTFGLSNQATIAVEILDSRNRSIRNLYSGATSDPTVRLTWDGRDSRGRRVGSGNYRVHVTARDSNDAVDTSAPFTVSGSSRPKGGKGG